MLMVAILGLIHLAAGLVVTLHFWRPRRMSDVPAVWILDAFTTFYGGPIVLGIVTGRMNRWTVWASAIVAGGLALWAWRRRPSPCFDRKDILGILRRQSRLERVLWVLIGGIIVALLLVGSMLPIRAWDASEYHSLNAMRWAESHRFILDSYGQPDVDPHVTAGEVWPNVKAVLPFLVLEYTGREDGTALAQWPYLLLLVSSLLGLFRRLKLPEWATASAILFVLAAPELLLQSLEAYADLGFFAGQVAVAFVALLVWQEGLSIRIYLLAGMAFAVLAGTKPTALMMCAALGVAFLAAMCWKSVVLDPPRRVAAVCVALAAVIIFCLAIPGPWYLHGIRKFGNPIYPIRVKIGYQEIFPGVYGSSVANEMVRHYQRTSGLRAWWLMMNEQMRQPVLSSWWSGLGAHTLILGVPALLLFLGAGWTEGRWKEYLPAVVLFGLIFLASPVKVWARMVLFELAIYGFAFAWVMTETTRGPRIALALAFAGLASYNIVRTIPSVMYRPHPPEVVAYAFLSGHRRQVEVDTFPDEYTALDFWREHVAREGDLLALPSTKPWFARPLRHGASAVRVSPWTPGTDVGQWASELRSLGATHLYAPRSSSDFEAALGAPEHFRLLMRRLDSGAESSWALVPLGEGALFAILPAKEAGR